MVLGPGSDGRLLEIEGGVVLACSFRDGFEVELQVEGSLREVVDEGIFNHLIPFL
jgi:hypothetical protein